MIKEFERLRNDKAVGVDDLLLRFLNSISVHIISSYSYILPVKCDHTENLQNRKVRGH